MPAGRGNDCKRGRRGLMDKNRIIERMLNPGVVAVIRADSSEQLMHVAKALRDGGVTAMEVTMTTPNALQVIEAVTKELGDSILMGVGTRSEEHTSELQSRQYLVCRLLL